MSRILAGLLVTLLACESNDCCDPFAELTPELVSGIWDINPTGCLTGNLPVRLQASEDGSLSSAQNAWTNAEAQVGFSRPLDATVDLATGDAEFHMWASGERTAALLFVGSLSVDGFS